MITNPLGPINFGKEKFFFQKLLVSAPAFGTNADMAITLTDKESILLVNQGPGVVEVSFNGLSLHAELNLSTGTSTLSIHDPSIVKIWFRLKSGAPSVVSVQNDAQAYSNTVNLSVGTIGGTSSNFNDFFPAIGTAVGFNDGTNMQGARVFDADTNGGAQYVLGSVLRASAPGGSVETGTAANPLRINPTGTTAQPVTDNGGSLTVDGTVTANIGTTNGLALDATLTNGTQKSIVRGGAKGATAAADVTSTSIDLNHQALDVLINNTSIPVTDNGGSLTVDGTVTANIGTTNGLALDATLTNGTQKSIVRGGAKGATAAADVTSTSINANHQALDVTLYNANGSLPLSLDGYGALDAFGRFRVSTPFTIFESKQIHNAQVLIWDTALTAGGGSTYSQSRASTTLSVTNPGDKAIHQTRSTFNYQAGLSFLILNSFVMGTPVTGVSKKIGYFNADNGIYFENNGAVNSLTIRSKVSGVVVPTTAIQSSWNIDRLDGSGPSGLTLDVTKAQIFVIDVEWLGVGSVRCGFVINGSTYYVHKFDHSNLINSVYMSTPNLPIRAEIENISGGAASLEQICCSIMSEGGYENPGLSYSADRGVNSLTAVNNLQLYPLVSIRQLSTSAGVVIKPEAIDILCTSSNTNFRWALVANPVINGIDAASWTTITGSDAEYDVSRTLTNYLIGGYIIASGYGTQKAAPISSVIQGTYSLGKSITGVRDQLVLAVQKIGNGTDNFIASFVWKEFS
jgi:hypothetical protein